MPDITMCSGGTCPQKNTCFRYLAKPHPHRQSYFTTPPNNGMKCDYYGQHKDYGND